MDSDFDAIDSIESDFADFLKCEIQKYDIKKMYFDFKNTGNINIENLINLIFLTIFRITVLKPKLHTDIEILVTYKTLLLCPDECRNLSYYSYLYILYIIFKANKRIDGDSLVDMNFYI